MAKLLLDALLLIGWAPHKAGPAAVAAAPVMAPQAAWEEGARSLDPSLRGRSLALLIRTAATADSPYAQRALLDPAPWVARQGIAALAARPDGRPVLLAAVDSPTVPAQARCLAAQASGDAAAQARVAPLAWETDDALTATLCGLVGAQGGDPTSIKLLAHTMRDGVMPLDVDFARDLGRSGLVALREPLAAAIEGAEPEMALPLAMALFELGGGDKALVDALTGPSEEAAMAALDLLAASENPAARPLIAQAARRAPGAAALYARLLGLGDGSGDVAAFTEALAAEDRELTFLAFEALSAALRQPDPPDKLRRAAVAPVQAAATDEDEPLRAAAAAVLGAPGMDQALLRTLQADPDLAVRVAAAAAPAGL